MKIHLRVHANSSQEKMQEISQDSYEIWIKTKPIGGKANVQLEKFLSKYFKKDARITSGLTSKNKVVELE